MKKLFPIFVFLFFAQAAIAQTCLSEGINFNRQGQIDSFNLNYPACTSILGDVIVESLVPESEIKSLDGLSQLTAVGSLSILNNESLTNIDGLSNISTIDGLLHIVGNYGLINLAGLSNITTINGDLKLSVIDSLTNLDDLSNITSVQSINISAMKSLTNLDGLSNITSETSKLLIAFNAALTNLDGLKNIPSCKGPIFIWYNDILSDISGIADMDLSGTTNLTIFNNPMLSTCALESICAYLDLEPANFSIAGNDTGCLSTTEIEAQCNTTGIHNIKKQNLSIYPNPSSDMIHILEVENNKIFQIQIFNTIGQLVLAQKKSAVDISNFPKGIYRVKADTRAGALFGKFLVE